MQSNATYYDVVYMNHIPATQTKSLSCLGQIRVAACDTESNKAMSVELPLLEAAPKSSRHRKKVLLCPVVMAIDYYSSCGTPLLLLICTEAVLQ